MVQLTSLPAIAQLPSTDSVFLDAARDMALIGGGLMAATGSPLVMTGVPDGRRGTRAPVTLWSDRLVPCAERGRLVLDGLMFRPALDALCEAADALFDRLDLWGWRDIDNPGLCAVTDGTGLLLSTRGARVGEGPGWLLSLAYPSGARTVLPPAADTGLWPLLRAEVKAATRREANVP